ncbi:8699_t:CDS:2 [Entrophospora sp. SA101]|nr:8699_t:CDS:2 [Entrophospora sp. SA101]
MTIILGIDSARHKLIAIRRQEGIEEVKRKGIIIDREVSPYEVPLNPHGLIQAKLISIMDNWSVQLQVIGELDVIVGTRSIYRSDISVQPRNRRQPQPSQAVNSSRKPYPTLVVEIATIKLFPPRQNGSVALLELLYLRNNPNPTIPVTAKSFGTASLHHYPYKSTIIATILDPQAKLSNFQPGSESSSAIPNFRINFKSI